MLEGDQPIRAGAAALQGFGRARFAASCAALVRSGYPVLVAARVVGDLAGEGHAVTIVGFRPGASPAAARSTAVEEDGSIQHVYVHDDNLGPSVRFAIDEVEVVSGQQKVAVLRADPPDPLHRHPALSNPTVSYLQLMPTSIIAALPEEIRMSSDYLNRFALRVANLTARYLALFGSHLPGVTFSSTFLRVSDYLGAELDRRLSGRRLAKVRLALTSRARPMSLHLGVVRIGVQGTPVFDLLLDTSDSELSPQIFAHVMFQSLNLTWLTNVGLLDDLGVKVVAF